MNIVEDLANFYKENSDEIYHSLSLTKKEIINVFLLDKNGNINSITKIINHDEYINLYGSGFDKDLLKTVCLNSKYFNDDANLQITGGNKIIASTIPQLIKFVHKKGADVGITGEKEELLETYSNLMNNKISDVEIAEFYNHIESLGRDGLSILIKEYDLNNLKNKKDLELSIKNYYKPFESVKIPNIKEEKNIILDKITKLFSSKLPKEEDINEFLNYVNNLDREGLIDIFNDLTLPKYTIERIINKYYAEFKQILKLDTNYVIDAIRNNKQIDKFIIGLKGVYGNEYVDTFNDFYFKVKDTLINFGKVIDGKIIYNNLEIDNGDIVMFICEDEKPSYVENYKKYIKYRMFVENIFSITMGNSPKKYSRFQYLNTVYEDFYFKNNCSEHDFEMMINYATFMNIMRFIPNKFLVIDSEYSNNFTQNKEIFELFKDISNLKKDVKILHFNSVGDILYYDYVNTSNIYFRYKNYSFDNNHTMNDSMDNYILYRKFMNILGEKIYINFFGDNNKSIESIYGTNINITPLLNTIKRDMFDIVYLNKRDKSRIDNIYSTIKDFILNNNLLLTKKDKEIIPDRNKIYKILELLFNTKNEEPMNNLEKMINQIKGYVYFDSQHLLENNLNEKGLKLLKDKDERFYNSYKECKTHISNLVSYETERVIENINEFSYLLGVLFSYQKLHSVANNKHEDIIKFKNKKAYDALSIYIDTNDKYRHLRKDNSSYSKLESALLNYGIINNTENIDYIIFNLGYSESKKYINK